MSLAEWDVGGLTDALLRIDDRGAFCFLPETDSTNARCLQWLRDGQPTMSSAFPSVSTLRYGVMVAEQQHAGRGRLGRRWLGARGASLTFSLWFRFSRSDLSGLSLAVGAVVCEAISARLGQASAAQNQPPWALSLKWPNDLVHVPPDGEAFVKLGGILVEAVHHQGACTAVIGVGINVSRFSVETSSLSSGFAALADSGCHLSPAEWLRVVCPPLLLGALRFDSEGFAGFRPQFETLNALRGQRVQAEGVKCVGGVVEGVGLDGSLELRDASGALIPIHSSEVQLQRGGCQGGLA